VLSTNNTFGQQQHYADCYVSAAAHSLAGMLNAYEASPHQTLQQAARNVLLTVCLQSAGL
jgi:hypothetical protein